MGNGSHMTHVPRVPIFLSVLCIFGWIESYVDGEKRDQNEKARCIDAQPSVRLYQPVAKLGFLLDGGGPSR